LWRTRALMLWVVPVDGGKKMTELWALTISPPDCRPAGPAVNDWRPQFHSGWQPAAGRDAPGPASRRPGSIAAHIRSSAWPKDRGRRSSGRPAGTRNQEGTEAKEARPRGDKSELLHGLAGWLQWRRVPEARLVRSRRAQERARSKHHASSVAALVRTCRASLGSGLVCAQFAADAAMAPGPPTKHHAPWMQSLNEVLTIKVNGHLSSDRVRAVEALRRSKQ
jgi:hypothetical protein